MNRQSLILTFAIFNSVILAQAPDIEWQNTIGGFSENNLYSIQQTRDGGYILGGSSESGISGDKTEESIGEYDYWVVKINSTGQTIEWQSTIGRLYEESLKSIQQTTDGGYILGGSTQSEFWWGDYDYGVVKLDSIGQIVWQNIIGGTENDILHSIQQTRDGGYILGGYSGSGSKGRYDYWIVKLDGEGNIIWQNTIGGSNDNFLYSIQQTTDGGYILGGYSNSGISGDKTESSQGNFDYWIIKLDSTGNIYWQNTIGGSGGDFLKSIQQTTDGGYILGGYSESGISGDKIESSQGTYDYWVVKLNADIPLEIEQIPQEVVIENFIILPAYPNPFNPSTTITYGLEKDDYVKVEVFDISGKLISILQNNYQTQGWHSITWKGTNQQGKSIPAGLYFSKLTSDNKIKTIKLMLLK